MQCQVGSLYWKDRIPARSMNCQQRWMISFRGTRLMNMVPNVRRKQGRAERMSLVDLYAIYFDHLWLILHGEDYPFRSRMIGMSVETGQQSITIFDGRQAERPQIQRSQTRSSCHQYQNYRSPHPPPYRHTWARDGCLCSWRKYSGPIPSTAEVVLRQP